MLIIVINIFYHQIHANPEDWDGYTELNPPPPFVTSEESEGDAAPITGHWDSRLTSFQKLIMIKAFKEEKVTHVFM